MGTAEQQGPQARAIVGDPRPLPHRIVTAVLCLVLFTTINSIGSGSASFTGTRTAIELLGGGKTKKRIPITIQSLTAAH